MLDVCRVRVVALAMVIAGLTSGCAAYQQTLNSGSILEPAANAAFFAEYTGRAALTTCSPSKTGHFTFRGAGRADYLRSGVERGEMFEEHAGKRCVWHGDAILRSARHPGDSVTVTLGLRDRFGFQDPCVNPVTFTVRRGTGRLHNARGHGFIAFACGGGLYVDSWNGAITE
jgi:hypothetical protein